MLRKGIWMARDHMMRKKKKKKIKRFGIELLFHHFANDVM